MRTQISKWLPVLFVMFVIFLISAQPSSDLPNLDWADKIVKKGGHMIGYAALALSYWRAFDFRENKYWLAWLLAVLYALTDELHQAFVPGRHPTLFDALIFDDLGALISLWIAKRYRKQKHLDKDRIIAGDGGLSK